MGASAQPLRAQTALVTGAESGIGAAIAGALGAAGACVVVNYLSDRDAAEAVLADVEEGGGEGLTLQADVSREDEVARLFAGAVDRSGTIDILVNNAGIQKDRPFVEMALYPRFAIGG